MLSPTSLGHSVGELAKKGGCKNTLCGVGLGFFFCMCVCLGGRLSESG